MLKRLEPFKPTDIKDEKENMLQDWVFNSHFWIELRPDYYACEYCNTVITSNTVINDFPMCGKNPAIIKFKEKLVEKLG